VRRLVLLHTNDIHGRTEALARIATLVEEAREEAAGAAVLYVDAGDVEDTTNRLSNMTKGTALHRLLDAAGCQAVAVGNGTVIRYGPEPLVEQAAATSYPHLAANLWRDGAVVPGAQPRALLHVEGVCVGLIGLTPANWRSLYENAFGVELPEEAPLVREHAAALRAEGADVVILLSHLGLDRDRELAVEVGGELDLIIGGHSHSLLAEGEVVAGVPIAQAGEFGEQLGRIELSLDERGARVTSLRVQPVPQELRPHPALLAEQRTIEGELAAWLETVVGELDGPLELAHDRECSATAFMADVIRERMGADVAVALPGTSFVSGLPAGPVTRGALYDACPSPGVCAAARMTGAQLRDLLARGLDPELAADRPQALRGSPRGLLHLSGAEIRGGELLVAGSPLDPGARYEVAGSDWEIDTYGGYAREEWALDVRFDGTTIMREAVEEHLGRHGRIEPPAPRLYGGLEP